MLPFEMLIKAASAKVNCGGFTKHRRGTSPIVRGGLTHLKSIKH